MADDRWLSGDSLRRPEYTGANRCLPCTVVNLCLAVVLAAGLGVLWLPLGAAAFGASLVSIYYRGYLVPGTPALTQTYLPDRILRLFGKPPSGSARAAGAPAGDERTAPEADADAILDRAEVLTDCVDEDDVCLTDSFRRTWLETMAEIEGDERRQRASLVATLDADIDPETVSLVERDGTLRASVDGTDVGSWLSRAAFVADVSAAAVLAGRDASWGRLDAQARGTVLARLRLFLEECPSCGGATTIESDSGDACCWSRDITTVRCTGCGARLLEMDELAYDDGRTAFI